MSDATVKVLVIDAGHTRVKLALCHCPKNLLPQIHHEVAVEEVEGIPWEEICKWLSPDMQTICILTGSNQERVKEIQRNWQQHLATPLTVLQKQNVPITNKTKYPSKVGVDRLLTSVAVNFIREVNQPAIIVDSGTAVTVDYVNGQGEFCGGAILPGVRLCAKALHEYTTSLPHYDAKQLLDHVPNPIGVDTEAAIASGLFWGHVGAVKELVQRLQAHASSTTTKPPLVVITGGASSMLVHSFRQTIFLPDMSLQGLALTAVHIQNSGAGEEQ